ncbi:Saccharopine dehydrogenase NADP binding domain-containing protein [Plasmodiophora brassicae]
MTTTRPIDMVVFGATGFTGRHVVAYVKSLNDASLTVGIAGRSLAALQGVAKQVGIDWPVLVADVNDHKALVAMARQATVVVNCVGPFRFSGRQVVAACIEAGTHYVDISGEPEFLESVQLEFDEEAQRRQVVVVGSCGFDSVPSDIGALFVRQELAKRGATTVASIECFIALRSGPAGYVINFATYESAVFGIANAGNLRKIRRASSAKPSYARLDIVGPKVPVRSPYYFDERVGHWAVPFVGSDASVVRRTAASGAWAASDSAPPCAQFVPYLAISSTVWLCLYLLLGSVFSVLARFRWGRYLLLKFPSVFSAGLVSRQGPTEQQVKGTRFALTFFGKGYSKDAPTGNPPDVDVKAVCEGPDPGYRATSIAVVQCALVICREKATMPTQGGVLTPGAAFLGTSLIDRLHRNGITFTTASK